MKHLFLSFVLILSTATLCSSQSANELLLDADRQYSNEDYIAAEELYRKAKEVNDDLVPTFNLGNATFKQERYEEAVEHYLNATKKAKDKITNSDLHYNLGNAYLNQNKLDEAIDTYKQAIRLNPKNEEAKYNLAYAKEMKKMMQQQSQDQQQNNQNQDQQNQDEQEQEQEQNQEQQNQENQSENQEQQDQQESEQDSTSQQEPSGGAFDSSRLEKQTLDSLDAAKLLQIIQAEEQKVQEKLRKFNSNRKKPDKDW